MSIVVLHLFQSVDYPNCYIATQGKTSIFMCVNLLFMNMFSVYCICVSLKIDNGQTYI